MSACPVDLSTAGERAHRVLAILSAAKVERPLCELRSDHLDWWPRTSAGDRKWFRDCRDARTLRVVSRWDESRARDAALADWLAAHPGATTCEVRNLFGLPGADYAYAALLRIGATQAGRAPRVGWHGPPQVRWVLA